MRTTSLMKLLCICIFVAFAFSPIEINAQTAPENVYVEVTCYKDKGTGDLEQFMIDKGSMFNKEAQAQGMLIDWIILKVIYPNGADCECDYRTVSVFTDMAQLDKLTDSKTGFQIAGKVFGDQAEATWNKFMSMASDRGSSVYELKYSAVDGPTNSAMSSVRFFNIEGANEQEFLRLESEVWMPVVKEAVKAGMLNDYSVWERQFPRGTNHDGNYIAVADFNSFAHMSAIDFAKIAEIFARVHPGENMMDAINASMESGDFINEETMKAVYRLNSPTQ